MSGETGKNIALRACALGIGYRHPPLRLSPEQGLEFALEAGTLCAVVGINGIGKSTLLRTLAGMQPALEGRVELMGAPLKQQDTATRARRLSVVLTAPPASRNLKVTELVRLGRHPYTDWLGRFTDADRAAVRQALAQMELESLQYKACHTLSDGQLQRVMIARALAQQTPVILLDEPTTHLDLHHKVRILKSLKSIAESQGKTVLFTSHEIDLAIQLCTHILVLTEGGYAFGTPCELIREGAFDALFPADSVHFDPKQGAFRVKK